MRKQWILMIASFLLCACTGKAVSNDQEKTKKNVTVTTTFLQDEQCRKVMMYLTAEISKT